MLTQQQKATYGQHVFKVLFDLGLDDEDQRSLLLEIIGFGIAHKARESGDEAQQKAELSQGISLAIEELAQIAVTAYEARKGSEEGTVPMPNIVSIFGDPDEVVAREMVKEGKISLMAPTPLISIDSLFAKQAPVSALTNDAGQKARMVVVVPREVMREFKRRVRKAEREGVKPKPTN